MEENSSLIKENIKGVDYISLNFEETLKHIKALPRSYLYNLFGDEIFKKLIPLKCQKILASIRPFLERTKGHYYISKKVKKENKEIKSGSQSKSISVSVNNTNNKNNQDNKGTKSNNNSIKNLSKSKDKSKSKSRSKSDGKNTIAKRVKKHRRVKFYLIKNRKGRSL